MAREFKLLSKVIKLAWLGLVLGIITLVGLFVYISKTKIPDTEELENPKYEYASIIYDDQLEEVGRYFKYNREWVTHESLNPFLVDALIATEDERFNQHSGIDFRSTMRAFLYMGKKGGASTISQQLAKQFFTKRSRNIVKRVWQKMKEWAIAIAFEKRYTKEEILAMYLNKFEFIYDSYGVSAAAKTYFGKNQKDLSIQEAATLVGMLKNPWIYNPKKYPETAMRRRNIVLGQMYRNNFIDEKLYKTAIASELKTDFKRNTHYDGNAPYFRSTLTKYINNLLKQEAYRKPDGTKYDIYLDGLQIYTTLNVTMQEHAEMAMKDHMKIVQRNFFNVWDDLDPWTYDANDYQLDLRKNKLNQLVRESERFQQMRSNYLSKISQKVLEKFPKSRLWDADIIRMRKASINKDHLNKLVKDQMISQSRANTYAKVIEDPLHKELQKKWDELNKSAAREFNKKRKLTVFDYTASGETSIEMSPLDSIRYHRMHLQLGSVSIDPTNGHVKTWVGGIGNKYFKYDHVTSNRQVGSTFKPFIYSTAIFHQGMSPCQKVEDIQYTIPAKGSDFGLRDSWSPQNANKKFSGESLTLMEGLKQSKNSISVWLMKQLGNVNVVIDLAENMGIGKNKIPKYPSICLGTPELSVLEMTSAYTTFANNGIHNTPIFLKKITDKNGKVIYTAKPQQRRALPETYNYAMVQMLKYAARIISWEVGQEMGGKTGTTDDYVDGWFMGITPQLVTGTWVGGEDTWMRFLTLQDGQGGVMARPYFTKFMKRILRDTTLNFDTTIPFEIPNDPINTDCSIYDNLIPMDGNPDSIQSDVPKKVKILNQADELDSDL